MSIPRSSLAAASWPRGSLPGATGGGGGPGPPPGPPPGVPEQRRQAMVLGLIGGDRDDAALALALLALVVLTQTKRPAQRCI